MDKERIRKLIKEKQIWIYMVGRWQKDFEYVFPELNIKGYIDDRVDRKTWQDRLLLSSDKFVSSSSAESSLIICCMPKRLKQTDFELSQVFPGYKCVYAEDIFFLLDDEINDVIGDREIVVWGTGKIAEKKLPSLLNSFRIESFIDNDENKHEFHGMTVRQPQDAILVYKQPFIIIANSYYREIANQLLEHGMKEGKDFCYYKYLRLPSELIRKTWNDTSFYALECHTMLHHLDVLEEGELNCCCTTFMQELLGSLLDKDFTDVWNSKWHRIMCVSILNQTYSFCRRDLCPALVCKERKHYEEQFDVRKYPEIEKNPSSVNICIDNTCNLYCESCRNKIIIADGEKKGTAELVAKKIERDILPHVNFVMMAGNGEVFLSNVYRKLWTSLKGKKAKFFQILTNGTLFTEKVWSEFKVGRTSSIFLCVSIDAATKETYPKIRRGGNWNNLMENMKFASSLRKKGEIAYFRLNFVVQRGNYKEIPQFIEMAKSLNVDRVLFTRILNWGTYSSEDFEKITMVDEHGYPKPELQRILDMPICKDSIVDMGTFNWEHVYNESDKIGSYYLWEIDNYSNMQIEEMVLNK